MSETEPHPDAGSPTSVEPERDLFGNTPKGRADWSHRRGEPRGLALGWTLYLMVASVFAFGPSAWAAADPSTYRPAAVRLVVLVSIGLFVLWPLVRLSQAWPRTAVRSAIVDAAVLLSPAMLLIWPHVVLAWWPVEVAGALTVLLLGWTGVATALLVGLASGDEGVTGRVVGLGVWLGAVVVAPLGALVLGLGGGLAAEPGAAFSGAWWMVSPVSGVHEIARDRSWSGRPAQVAPEHWRAIGVVWMVAGVVWGWALLRRGAALEAGAEAAVGADAGPDVVAGAEGGESTAAESVRA
ncbi:MAG: hypothetical protein AAF297_01045 [Planctomycetota bacterium]